MTVARRPSGTFATMIPIKKMTASSHSYCILIEIMKKLTPRKTATPVMMLMKCSISLAIGVLPTPRPLARCAILPITVRSPVAMTTPLAVPSTAFVEKKAIFLVSSGLSFENSGVRCCGSDSPVSDELST